MGCFNVTCDLTGTQIIAGDPVVVLELPKACRTYVLEDVKSWLDFDQTRVYSLLIDQSSAINSSRMSGSLLELLSDNDELSEGMQGQLQKLQALIENNEVAWRTFARGHYDDYGGAEDLRPVGQEGAEATPGPSWRPYDDREPENQEGGRQGWHAHAMVHAWAFDEALGRWRQWKAKELAQLEQGGTYERLHAERWQGEQRKATGMPQAWHDWYDFLAYCQAARVEPFAPVKAFGSQGYEQYDMDWRRDLLSLSMAQLERIEGAHARSRS